MSRRLRWSVATVVVVALAAALAFLVVKARTPPGQISLPAGAVLPSGAPVSTVRAADNAAIPLAVRSVQVRANGDVVLVSLNTYRPVRPAQFAMGVCGEMEMSWPHLGINVSSQPKAGHIGVVHGSSEVGYVVLTQPAPKIVNMAFPRAVFGPNVADLKHWELGVNGGSPCGPEADVGETIRPRDWR